MARVETRVASVQVVPGFPASIAIPNPPGWSPLLQRQPSVGYSSSNTSVGVSPYHRAREVDGLTDDVWFSSTPNPLWPPIPILEPDPNPSRIPAHLNPPLPSPCTTSTHTLPTPGIGEGETPVDNRVVEAPPNSHVSDPGPPSGHTGD